MYQLPSDQPEVNQGLKAPLEVVVSGLCLDQASVKGGLGSKDSGMKDVPPKLDFCLFTRWNKI